MQTLTNLKINAQCKLKKKSQRNVGYVIIIRHSKFSKQKTCYIKRKKDILKDINTVFQIYNQWQKYSTFIFTENWTRVTS